MDDRIMVLALGIAALAGLGCAIVRVVPAGHSGVIVRAGRPGRTAASGLVAVVPLLDRVTILPLQPSAIDPLTVAATSRDAVEVRLAVAVVWKVADPVLAAQALPDVLTATAEAVERALHAHVAGLDLSVLLHDRRVVLASLPGTARDLVAPLGVELVDVDLLHAEVRVGPELLRLLA